MSQQSFIRKPADVSSDTHTQTSTTTITRAPVGQFGCVGSLYDGYQDKLRGKLNVRNESWRYLTQPASCKVINGKKDERLNLLQIIDIEDDLRLSVLLHSAPMASTATIVNCPLLIGEHTRILHYYYSHRVESLPDNPDAAKRLIESSALDVSATHVITSVEWGIDVVVVLNLPDDDKISNEIDAILEKIRLILLDQENINDITKNDIDMIKQIIHTLVYSNIPDLAKMTTIIDVYRYIRKMKTSSVHQRPLKYTLRPIKWLYPQRTDQGGKFFPLETKYINKVEEYLLQISAAVKGMNVSVKYRLPELLRGHLDKQLTEIYRGWSHLKKKFVSETRRWEYLITEVRKGRAAMNAIDKAFEAEEKMAFDIELNDFRALLDDLTAKGNLITDLQKDQFKYYNAADRGIRQEDKEKILQKKILSDNPPERVLCSNDVLKKQNQSKWDKLYSQLVSERLETPELQLIYVDFSYCSYELNDLIILSSTKKKKALPNSATTSSAEPSTTEIINILLLGESGVGKSTFINAFANYLTFNSLKEAQSREPTVLIPVSFLITVNDQFEERILKFGNVDDSTDEDHNHPGQSVTQHCKSYVFDLTDENGTKLRIIDTPGFGDTRGIAQDDINMQHILTYMNKLTHIHAVCILLKPNTSRLNIYFRSCLTQLFEFLGQNARDNFIFCFTNARSTFFAPGNTGPLLKKMLQSQPIGDITFNRTNTFCFDNESFRYLVAVQNAIEFSESERDEYESSWSRSVTESSRLLKYIRKSLTPYKMNIDLKSMKHAQLEISQMIRPMLEAMRNILRNLVLWCMESPNISIRLYPKAIDRPTAICLSCKRDPHRFHNVWIKVDHAHNFQDECRSCKCIPSQHCPIDYTLEYELSDNHSVFNRNEMHDVLKNLCKASAAFAHFLINVARTAQSDPFLSGFNRMIDEEREICSKQQPNSCNESLCTELETLKDQFERRRSALIRNKESSSLDTIYQWIDWAGKCLMVHEQMAAVREGEKRIMEKHEYQILQGSANVFERVTEAF